MANYYSGLCVGGPEAGKYLTHNAPYFYIALPKKPVIVFDEGGALFEYNKARYEHHAGLRGKFEIDLWLYNGMTVNEAFETIFTTYAQSSRKSCAAETA